MEDIKYDQDGNIIRSRSPKEILDNFNPLPSDDIQRKINFFFLPYNIEQHTKKYMTF